MKTVNVLIEKGLQQQAMRTKPRCYLGASLLGDPCERRIQYHYHQSQDSSDQSLQKRNTLQASSIHPAKQLKLFAMGHHLEPLIIHWMRLAGFTLSTENANGEQHGFKRVNGKIAGHVDGILLAGDGDFAYPALWECKTMSAKYWRDCVKRGLALSRPSYFVQIQLYMAYLSLHNNPALVTVLNKDSAELYHEWIAFDATTAQRYSDRAVNVITACQANEWLPRLANQPDYFVCKSCNWHTRCWDTG